MINTHTQTLAAGGSMKILGARSLVLKKPAFPVTLKLYGPQNTLLGSAVNIDKRFTFFAGFDAQPMSFEIVTASSQEIQAYSSGGQINIDDVEIANLTAPVERSLTAETVADVSCAAAGTTLVYAGHADAIEVLIENLSAETLRLGDVNAGAGRGKPLNPYSEAVIKTGAALYVYNPGGAAIDVAVTVLKV